jgi:hypothetical protein
MYAIPRFGFDSYTDIPNNDPSPLNDTEFPK